MVLFFSFMRTISINTAAELNDALKNTTGWANGKNFPVDHLHATVAESRWEYENIHGIYLTNEQHAWMGLWMALSNRNVLRKRHISYIKPTSPEDALGNIELFTVLPPEDILCDSAYVYLINPPRLCDREIVDIRNVPKQNKVETLLKAGFERQQITRRGRQQPGVVDTTGTERLVLVDEWQIALTNIPDIIPDTELAIRRAAIAELVGRVSVINSEVGEDYIR
jgi:hypothetical protein